MFVADLPYLVNPTLILILQIAFVAIFEIGSIICAAADGPNTFIAGRAIAGLGSAGTYVGVMSIIAQITP